MVLAVINDLLSRRVLKAYPLYRRHRAQRGEHRSLHILHMQKALTQMNIRLDQAVSDVTGQTGLAIIRAIVAGERDPHKLAALRNPRCKKTEEEIAQALTGAWREEHLFVLKQSLEFYDFYTRPIEACDLENAPTPPSAPTGLTRTPTTRNRSRPISAVRTARTSPRRPLYMSASTCAASPALTSPPWTASASTWRKRSSAKSAPI